MINRTWFRIKLSFLSKESPFTAKDFSDNSKNDNLSDLSKFLSTDKGLFGKSAREALDMAKSPTDKGSPCEDSF